MPDNKPANADDAQVQAVYATLRGVIDPELHENIVDLGMVRDATVTGDGVVTVSIALTIASCPLRSQIESDVRQKLLGVPEFNDVVINVGAMTPDEKSELMSRARLNARESAEPTNVAATTRVIAVSSGKGGVGKSTTTANLAHALRDLGFEVGVLDADVWGFSQHRMLGVDGQLGGSDGLMDPIVADEIKVVTMGSLVGDEQTALMWRGLVLTRAVEQFLNDVRWGELDYLLVDMPPGTGDIQMGLARMLPQAEMLLVTTPQAVAHKVAVRAANMARRSHMKVLGIVENMSAFTCEHGTTYEIFGHGGGELLADELATPLIAQVPLDPDSVAAGDDGVPVITAHPDSDAAAAYRALAAAIADALLPPVEMAGCTARIEAVFEQIAT